MTDTSVEAMVERLLVAASRLDAIFDEGFSPQLHIREAADLIEAQAQTIAALRSALAATHNERVEYEERILAAEMRVERLKRLIRQPEDRGGYVGDNYYPVGGTKASHEWDGFEWQWLAALSQQERG